MSERGRGRGYRPAYPAAPSAREPRADAHPRRCRTAGHLLPRKGTPHSSAVSPAAAYPPAPGGRASTAVCRAPVPTFPIEGSRRGGKTLSILPTLRQVSGPGFSFSLVSTPARDIRVSLAHEGSSACLWFWVSGSPLPERARAEPAFPLRGSTRQERARCLCLPFQATARLLSPLAVRVACPPAAGDEHALSNAGHR